MIRVEIACSPAPGQVDVTTVELPDGATLAMALEACEQSGGWLRRREVRVETAVAGVWGRLQPKSCELRDGDRVEIYRPLRCDPKEARRRRHQKIKDLRGARSTASRSGGGGGGAGDEAGGGRVQDRFL